MSDLKRSRSTRTCCEPGFLGQLAIGCALEQSGERLSVPIELVLSSIERWVLSKVMFQAAMCAQYGADK